MRKQRAIDDAQALDKKRLLRDVRPFPERLVSALRNGQLQLFGIFACAGCLLVFPAAANVFFFLGCSFFFCVYSVFEENGCHFGCRWVSAVKTREIRFLAAKGTARLLEFIS